MKNKKHIVPIMGVPFEVQYLAKVDSKDANLGETHGPERILKIKKGLTPEINHDTLLHEMIHAILYVSGQSELLTHKQEEAITLALENGLRQLVTIKDEYLA